MQILILINNPFTNYLRLHYNFQEIGLQMDLYKSYYSQPSHYYVVNSPYVQGGMADLFDISSAIKSRKTFEDMSSKVGVNPKAQADTSKMRRDPRLKSPKPEDKKSIDNRRPDYQQIQQQQDWMAQTQDYRQVQQQYAMAGYGDVSIPTSLYTVNT